jgi:hypothetical protein
MAAMALSGFASDLPDGRHLSLQFQELQGIAQAVRSAKGRFQFRPQSTLASTAVTWVPYFRNRVWPQPTSVGNPTHRWRSRTRRPTPLDRRHTQRLAPPREVLQHFLPHTRPLSSPTPLRPSHSAPHSGAARCGPVGDETRNLRPQNRSPVSRPDRTSSLW